MTKLTKTEPAWHAQIAKDINSDFAETNEMNETARRRRARLGFKFLFVKSAGKADGSIPHGEFQAWLTRHCPAIPIRTAGDYVGEAKSVCDLLQWQIGEIRRFETPPHLLLSARPAELSEKAKAQQKQLLNVIDQQGHVRAVTQYKQVKLEDDATVPKVGRAKGSDGNPRAKRLSAKERARMDALDVCTADSRTLVAIIEDNADDAHFGALAEHHPDLFEKVIEAHQLLGDTLKRVKHNRK